MIYSLDIPICEDLDAFAWDPDEVRDLVRTAPLRFDDEGMPVGFMAEQLFGFEGTLPGGRSL